MAFSMIASKKAAPVAALMIRKLAFNDVRALQAASVQSTRSFNTNSPELEALDDESKLGGFESLDDESKLRWLEVLNDKSNPGWTAYRMSRDIDDPYFSSGAFNLSNKMVYPDRAKYFSVNGAETLIFPLTNRTGCYEIEDANRLEIRMDMPGLEKEHVKLSTKKNTLIIKGDGEEEIGEEDGARRYYNRIDFPEAYGYKLNEIEAEMKNGILKIVVPKGREQETKDVFHINVK